MKFKNIIHTIISQDKYNAKALLKAKRVWAKKHGYLPKNSEIYADYLGLLKNNPKLKNKQLEELLHIKKVRTISGVAPVAILTKPYPCPGNCVYCPTQENIPKSYLDDEPAVMRAISANFDPYLQAQRRLKQYLDIGHTPEKIELIVIGGSFSALPERYKYWYARRCFEACNNFPSKKGVSKELSLKQEKAKLILAQKLNEKAKFRIIGLTLETRPDLINEKEIRLMRDLGCTRVEIGVQTIYDSVFKKIKRGHGINEVIKASSMLKNTGFKTCYHLMPNLPSSNTDMDLKLFKHVYTKPEFKPDMVKIYPCVVTKNTELYNWFKQGKFQAYSDKVLTDLLIKIKEMTPRWVRINRLYRDIPAKNIMAGSKISNLRQVLVAKMKLDKKKCQCVRCREIRGGEYKNGLKLKITSYLSSDGKEYFLEYIDNNDKLYALLRLRLAKNENKSLFKVLDQAAIIKEVHTYGKALAVKDKTSQKTQHKGLGKKLIKKAEKIAKKQGYQKMAIIAGVGARGYYKKLGYKLKDTYMIKEI